MKNTFYVFFERYFFGVVIRPLQVRINSDVLIYSVLEIALCFQQILMLNYFKIYVLIL